MAKNGFDFSGFFSAPVEREFYPTEQAEKDGNAILVKINLDLLTLEKMEQLEAEFNSIFEDAAGLFAKIDEVKAEIDAGQKKEDALEKVDAITEELEKVPELPKFQLFAYEKASFKFYARALAGEPGNDDATHRLLHSWNVVKGKTPVPISYESFLQMPPHGLRKLYRFCVGEANNPTPQEKKA